MNIDTELLYIYTRYDLTSYLQSAFIEVKVEVKTNGLSSISAVRRVTRPNQLVGFLFA